MPTVFRQGKYRFFFYSKEGSEPPHIHVTSGDGDAKFWLQPAVELAYTQELNRREITDLEEIIRGRVDEILAAWEEHFKQSE